MKKQFIYAAVLASVLGYVGLTYRTPSPAPHLSTSNLASQSVGNTDRLLAQAFTNRLNDIQVEGEGKIIKILPEDTKGNRHQLFLLQLASGQTLLLSHNISLAPRIETIKEGDSIRFFGEYKWNEKGGVIHWTHHDPRHKHIAGWVSHNGKTYQ